MIRRRKINETLLRPATSDEVSAEPMSNGEGPLLYEDSPYYTTAIWVCGGRYPDENQVWVSLKDDEYSEPRDFCLGGLSLEKAKMIGENLANTHRNQGDDALLDKVFKLGFVEY